MNYKYQMIDIDEIKKKLLQNFTVGSNKITINESTGEIDIFGYDDMVELINPKLYKLPVSFNEVTCDNFMLTQSLLVTLEGSPKIVHTLFSCVDNSLVSLVGGPNVVDGNYICFKNPLTSIDGLAEKIGGRIMLPNNENLPILRLVSRSNEISFVNNDRVVSNDSVSQILKKYAGQKPLRQAIIQCQRELIDAGYKGNARL